MNVCVEPGLVRLFYGRLVYSVVHPHFCFSKNALSHAIGFSVYKLFYGVLKFGFMHLLGRYSW